MVGRRVAGPGRPRLRAEAPRGRFRTLPPRHFSPRFARPLDLNADAVPLAPDADGVVRVAGTRVRLDTVVGAFRPGATAEEIAQQYPALDLAAVYAVIAFYLRRRPAVDVYLAEQAAASEAARKRAEARFDPDGLRERLLVRRVPTRASA